MSDDIIKYLEDNLISGNIDYTAFFMELKNKFPREELVCCYSYILQNKADFNLLNQTIREVNSLRHKANLAPLIDYILRKEADVNLRVLAIKTISNYKDTTAVSSLLYCLNDKDSNYKIRLAAAEALGKIGDKNAFEALTNVVCDEEEKSVYVRESAVVALGMLGDKRALDVFNSILNTKQMFLDKFSYFKERILEAMAKLDISKDKYTIDILKKSLMDPSSRIRISAIEALSNTTTSEAYRLIYDSFRYDSDIEVRKNALIALYNISDRKILDEVVNGDYPPELKECADEIIKEYEDE